ncbi:SHC-transforming protein 1 [Onthophagus taurus]|uniref:SHC-transforming protein 1 n=1 Tax=Onthophagus taurus TaxID=166361 RepID=UPI000C206D04|nr:SHC-transforming protein 1 [Onthophagus taurus]
MSGFISKPSGGWIHSDNLIANKGATYSVRYIGCLEVKTSMKTLDFKTRSNVAKVCISKVSEAAGLTTADKKRKIDKNVLRAIAEEPNMDHAGCDVSLNISSAKLTLTSLESNDIIASHDMPRISFASGGDTDTMDFVAYIAKDASEWRACYVLECGGGHAKDVISTIGQAFELRYQQYCKPVGVEVKMLSGGDADKDYYNDLPGKVPPDVAMPLERPPPVPPLPTVVPSFTTLPLVQAPQTPQTPNLIDLNSYVMSLENHHEYVNDINTIVRERDVFDMQPFTNQNPPPVPCRQMDEQLEELKKEVWFHGQITRREAEGLLINDGDFLVRESPNSSNQYVLSGMQDNTKRHLLLIDPEGVVRTKDRIFNSVSHLIIYHCQNALPIISAESALVLRTPVPRKMPLK